MKKLNLLFICVLLMGVPFMITSCEGNDMGTVEVVLSKAKINIPFAVDENQQPANAKAFASRGEETGFYRFSGKVEGLNMDHEMFSELKNQHYSSLDMIVQKVTVQFVKNDSTEGVIKEFISGGMVSGETEEFTDFVSTEDFELNSLITDEKLKTYIQDLFDAIKDGKTIDIYGSGLTDILPEGIEEVGYIIITPTVKAKMKLVKE